MKSRTSFFNFTVLKKDLTRFWPLWGLILIISILNLLTGRPLIKPDDSPYNIVLGISGHSIIQFFFGGLCALLVFGDLFKPRAAGMLHALPIRREGWFFTHTVSAILIYLLAMVIPNLPNMLLLKEFWYLVPLSTAVQLGMFLFYFSVAAFAIQCAGSWLGAAAVYVTVNFLTQLLLFLGESFYQPYLYGIPLESPVLQLLCPVTEVTSRAFVEATYRFTEGVFESPYPVAKYGIVPDAWWYLLAVVAAGAVFWGLALLLYRRRHIEKAGSFIALRWVAVSFLLILTLTVSAVWFNISSSYILLLVGLGVGFFCGLMLLEKRLKVFRKQTLLTFGIVAVALFATIGIVRADPLKLVDYVPAVDEVESAVFSINQYVVTSADLREEAVTLDTPEELQLLEALHKGLITERDDVRSYNDQELTLVYRLKNGRTVRRVYPYPEKSELRQQANKLLSRLDVFDTTDTLRNIVSIRYNHDNDTQAYPDLEILAEPLQPGDFSPFSDVKISSPTLLNESPEAIAMWEALQKDCLDGNMSQLWGYQTAICGTLQITFRNEDGSTETLMLYVYTSCENFRSFLLTAKDAQ